MIPEEKRGRFDADEDVIRLVLMGVNRVVEKRPTNPGGVKRNHDGPIASASGMRERKKGKLQNPTS